MDMSESHIHSRGLAPQTFDQPTRLVEGILRQSTSVWKPHTVLTSVMKSMYSLYWDFLHCLRWYFPQKSKKQQGSTK